MKYAFITSNLHGGGAQKAMVTLASVMANQGHEAHLILLEDQGVYSVPPEVRKSALLGAGRKLTKGWLGKRWLAWSLRRHVLQLAVEQPFDAVISTLPFCDEICHLARLPRLWFRIANHLGAQIASASPAKAVKLNRRYRKMYQGANLICVSDGVAADMKNFLEGRINGLERIYNPFDFDAIRELSRQAAFAIPPEPYFVHAARFAPQKRHDLLIQAFGRSRSIAKLVLLCDPCAALGAMIALSPRRDDIIVSGFQANPYPWLARARVAVVCSDHEGMPNVLIDALACGTAVISTDCPSGPREILGETASRWLVPCGQADLLALALDDAFSANTRPKVDLSRFSIHEAVRGLEKIANWTPSVHGRPCAV